MNLWWYSTRAAGIVAWVMLGLSVLWGLATTTAILQERRKPGWLLDLHSWLGGAACVFTGIHLLALLGDDYVEFGLRELLVPMTSTWRPWAVAWGIVSFYLLVSIQITSLMRRRLPKKLWRALHTSAFVLFVTAGVHAGMSGTDISNIMYITVTILITSLVVLTTLYRILAGTVRRNAAANRPARERDVTPIRARQP